VELMVSMGFILLHAPKEMHQLVELIFMTYWSRNVGPSLLHYVHGDGMLSNRGFNANTGSPFFLMCMEVTT